MGMTTQMAFTDNPTSPNHDPLDWPFDFLTMLYGWFLVIGHVLGLYNLAIGRKCRGKFFLIYATLGPFIVIPYLVYSKRYRALWN